MNIKRLYTLFILMLILQCACTKETVSNMVKEPSVYITFNIGINGSSLLRAQGNAPSINEDTRDKEDYVEQIAVFAYASGVADNAKPVAAYIGNATSVVLRLSPATYDFYFIANHEVNDISMTKGDLKALMFAANAFRSIAWPKTLDKPFPMSRVYLKQILTAADGGTFANPKLFKPQVNNATGHQLAPVSDYGQDWQGNQRQEQINLVRACAKINLTLTGVGLQSIKKLKYVQAATQYSLLQYNGNGWHNFYTPSSAPSSPILLSVATPISSNEVKTSICVPERLFGETEDKGWNRDKLKGRDEPIGDVNYIQITMQSGKEYKIPIITNDLPAGKNYLEVARDKTQANYNVIRNHKYVFTINVPEQEKELEVSSMVLPWNVKTIEDKTYLKYKLLVDVDNIEGEFRIEEQDGRPVILFYNDQTLRIPVKFISHSGNGFCVPTITNGAYFSIISPQSNITSVAEDGQYTQVEVQCDKGDNAYKTEFYFNVDFEEFPYDFLYNDKIYHLAGRGHRLLLQQIL